MLVASILLPLAVGGLSAWLTMGSMRPVWGFDTAAACAAGMGVSSGMDGAIYSDGGRAPVGLGKSDAARQEKKRALTLYGGQLAVNFVWPLLFFGRGWYGASFLWLLLLLALVLAAVAAFGRIPEVGGMAASHPTSCGCCLPDVSKLRHLAAESDREKKKEKALRMERFLGVS